MEHVITKFYRFAGRRIADIVSVLKRMHMNDRRAAVFYLG